MTDGDGSAPLGGTHADAAALAGDRWLGALIGERYRILDLVGTGGMGTVYRAEHVLMKKIVAVKRLRDDLDNGDEVVKRFEREAQSASRLSHENIVQVMDFGRAADGALFLVMEFLAGESLSARLARSGRLAVPHTVAYLKQILAALEHAHGASVVHRDLKPDNIMLLPPSAAGGVERVRLLDFGIAKVTTADADARGPTLTRAGLVFGTPDYMAPEQATGGAVDTRVDLYACGVILFEMLTGRRPFVADNAVSVMTMHITVEPPMPSLVAPEAQIPGAFDRIVGRAMEKDRQRRYASAAEFLAALESAVAPPSVAAAAAHPTTRILSVAGTGGAGKPSRITLTLDVDNLRSRMVALGRLLRRAAAAVWALLRAGVTRGWARLPPRLRWPVAVSLVVAMLGGAVWMAARSSEPDPEEEFERAVEEASAVRPTGDEGRKAHEGAKKKKRKRTWEDALPF